MTDVIVVGAGPAGLSTAIAAKKGGLSTVVLEKGSLVDAIRRFPTNCVWFSTPELLEIGGVPFVISTTRPTRVDTLNYYRKVVSHYEMDVRCFDPVSDVKKEGDQFVVGTGKGREYRAGNVVVATGYFDQPNRLNVAGEDLSHVAHYYDEPFKYAGLDVVVVGGRNSAVEAALDLFRHGARVTMVHRGKRLSEGVKYWILPDIENRLKGGEVGGLFDANVTEIRGNAVVVRTPDDERELTADFVFILIGFQPDTERLKAYGVEILTDSLAPRFNEKTFETNVKGLYVAGSIVAGKNTNKVFVENGRSHGAVIVSSILSGKGVLH